MGRPVGPVVVAVVTVLGLVVVGCGDPAATGSGGDERPDAVVVERPALDTDRVDQPFIVDDRPVAAVVAGTTVGVDEIADDGRDPIVSVDLGTDIDRITSAIAIDGRVHLLVETCRELVVSEPDVDDEEDRCHGRASEHLEVDVGTRSLERDDRLDGADEQLQVVGSTGTAFVVVTRSIETDALTAISWEAGAPPHRAPLPPQGMKRPSCVTGMGVVATESDEDPEVAVAQPGSREWRTITVAEAGPVGQVVCAPAAFFASTGRDDRHLARVSGTAGAPVVVPVGIGQPILAPTALRDEAQLVAVLDGLNGLHLLDPSDASAAPLDIAATGEAGIDAMKGALGYFGRLGDRVVRLGFPDPSIAAGEVTVTDVGTS